MERHYVYPLYDVRDYRSNAQKKLNRKSNLSIQEAIDKETISLLSIKDNNEYKWSVITTFINEFESLVSSSLIRRDSPVHKIKYSIDQFHLNIKYDNSIFIHSKGLYDFILCVLSRYNFADKDVDDSVDKLIILVEQLGSTHFDEEDQGMIEDVFQSLCAAIVETNIFDDE